MSEGDRIRRRYEERDADASLKQFWTLRNPVVLHLAQERERATLAALQAAGVDLADARILDVGCGGGGEFANCLRWGARLDHLYGVELMMPRAQAALQTWGPRVVNASGAALPFADARFDLVMQNVVFSSIIDDAMRRAVAGEMLRVLRPGGWLLWYDAARTHNRDPHFRDVPAAELRALFPGLPLQLRRVSLHLGVLRRVHAAFGAPGMFALQALGLGKTHLLGLGRKP